MATRSPSPSSPTLSPWLAIWIKPRATIRRIVDSDPGRHVAVLAMLLGVGQALSRAVSRYAGDALSLPVILVICAVAGSLGGLVTLHVGGALLRWTGSWFGGRASPEEVRSALAWSSVPTVFGQVLWIPALILVGREMFTSVSPTILANPLLALPILAIAGAQSIFALWAFVVLVICLGEVHRFSVWKALSALLTGGLIVFVPLYLVLVLLSGLTFSP